MDSLTLTIESHADEDLETEATFNSTGTSIKVGRRAENDWILPDQTRHISGTHFDVLWEDGRYILHDLSTNGTFLNGSKQRIEGPHPLTDGDRIHVGIYVIHARLRPIVDPVTQAEESVDEATQPPRSRPQSAPNAAQGSRAVQAPPGAAFLTRDGKSHVQSPGHSLFTAGQAAQTPDFARFQSGVPDQTGVSAPPAAVAKAPDDALSDPFADILGAAISDEIDPLENQSARAPSKVMPEDPEKPQQDAAEFLIPDDDFTRDLPKPSFDLESKPPAFSDRAEFSSELSQAPRGMGETFGAADDASPFSEGDLPPKPPRIDPVDMPPSPPPAPRKIDAAPAVDQAAAQRPAPPSAGDDFLRGFLEGAGIEGTENLEIPLHELGRILGACARLGTREMMQMLQDRSAVKLFVAQEDRTMRISNGNNPMKFMLDPEEAFEALFVVPRSGYQTGADGFENALTDIRKHQAAMMAAVQPAMADILTGLAPTDIESATGSSGAGVLGSGARKCWEEYNKRWKTRANQGENGMLDAFIDAFAKRYSEALENL